MVVDPLESSCSQDHANSLRATFYYPMTGLINLFIHILRFPVLSTAQSDIALLDVVAGHFAHMEFVTSSELNFPFARNVAALARKTVDKSLQVKLRSPMLRGGEQDFDLSQEMESSSQVRNTHMHDIMASKLNSSEGVLQLFQRRLQFG